MVFFSACPYDLLLWGGSNGEIWPDNESLRRGMCSFGLDWDEDVFRTEIIEGWDGHSYSKKSYSPQVNRSLSSHGPSLWFYSRNTHSGSRRVLPLKDLWESRRNSHDSIKSLQTHLDLPAIQTRGNCVPTFAHLSIPSKQWFTISHRPTP